MTSGYLLYSFYQASLSPRSRLLLLPFLPKAMVFQWFCLACSSAFGFMAEHPRTASGLDFAARHALRLGIVLLGLQVTLAQIAAMGALPAVGLLLVMACAFLSAMAAAKVCGQSRESGILAGGATAICGISAALALYGVIGRERLDQALVSVTLVGVTLASALAMAAYPVLATWLGLSDSQAGFFIGASVHDAAQAIGGAYDFSEAAGNDATVVKLARVALLAPVIALVAMWVGGGGKSATSVWRRLTFPWFIAGFLAVVAANSVFAVPPAVTQTGLVASKTLLLVAVTATAIRSRLALLVETGWQPLMPVFIASLASFVASLAVVLAIVK